MKIKYKVKYFKIRNKVIKNLIDIGENSFVQDGVTIKNYEKIVIGNNTSINQIAIYQQGGIRLVIMLELHMDVQFIQHNIYIKNHLIIKSIIVL